MAAEAVEAAVMVAAAVVTVAMAVMDWVAVREASAAVAAGVEEGATAGWEVAGWAAAGLDWVAATAGGDLVEMVAAGAAVVAMAVTAVMAAMAAMVAGVAAIQNGKRITSGQMLIVMCGGRA